MNNKVKDIRIKSHTYYFFDNIIIKRSIDPNILKAMKSHTKLLLFTTLDM